MAGNPAPRRSLATKPAACWALAAADRAITSAHRKAEPSSSTPFSLRCTQLANKPDWSAQDVRFSSACLGFSGGPADKESILREILPSDRTAGHRRCPHRAGRRHGRRTRISGDRRNRLHRLWAAIPVAVPRGPAAGVIFLETKAAVSGSRAKPCAPPCAGRKAGAFPRRCAPGCWMPPATRNINDLLHRCYTAEFPRPRVASLSILVNHAAEIGDPVALEILDDSRPRTGHIGRRGARTIVWGRGADARHLLRRCIREPDSARPIPRLDGIRGGRPCDGSGLSVAGHRSIARSLSRRLGPDAGPSWLSEFSSPRNDFP